MPVPILKILAEEKYFAGNPMLVALWTYENKASVFVIYDEYNSTELYRGEIYSISGWATTDISGIFKRRHVTAGSGYYKIALVSDEYGEYASAYFYVYAGGVSKLLHRRLLTIPNSGNIFDYKIKNQNGNFLLTTRSFDTLICIPEDELLPLSYYSKGMKFSVKNGINVLLTRDHSLDEIETVASIDFAALRETAAINLNRWISEFRIETDNGWACTVLITASEVVSDYSLKFLNSFGVYEKICLQADIDNAPDFSESEMIMEFDSQVNDFVSKNQRKEINDKYLVAIPYVNTHKLSFVRDLILSDNVIMCIANIEHKCNIKMQSGQVLNSTTGEPLSINLEITLVDTDEYHSPTFPETSFTYDNRTYLTINGDRVLIENSYITL